MNSFTVSFKGFAKTIYYLFYFQIFVYRCLKKIASYDGNKKTNRSFLNKLGPNLQKEGLDVCFTYLS